MYVSLYAEIPFYGGPEEGGWWGRDIMLVSHKQVCSNEVSLVKEQFEAVAKELGQAAKIRFGQQCINDMEHADALGIDLDSLPEVDGEATYFVYIEDKPGSREGRGDRSYS
jgi:hypothetical protein